MLEHAPTPIDGLIWALGLGSLRVSESVGIRLEDIDVTKRIIRVKIHMVCGTLLTRRALDLKAARPLLSRCSSRSSPDSGKNWPNTWLSARIPTAHGYCSHSMLIPTASPLRTQIQQRQPSHQPTHPGHPTRTRLPGSQGNYSSHDFRHSFGIWARNYVTIPGRPRPGLDLPEIQLLMGHASLKSTEIYASDLGIHTLVEVDASNALIHDLGAGRDINFYRGQAYARLGQELLNKGPSV